MDTTTKRKPLIPLFKVFMAPDLDGPLLKTIHSGYVTEGPVVKEFEKVLSGFLGTPVLTLNSGTSALTLALRLAGIEQGSEVITTPMTCQATNVAILALGGVPIWADIDPRTGLIDPISVSSRITNKTKAVMVVDWGGAPCDYDEILNAIGDRSIPVIEDAAHAFGSVYKKTPVGDLADYTCFSFQAIKHLTTVDGGAITTFSDSEQRRAKLLRWYGIDREAEVKEFRGDVDVVEYGYKFHMNDVNATIGLSNFQYIPEILSAHRRNAAYLDSNLNRDIYTNTNPSYLHTSSHWLYTTLMPNDAVRDKFKTYMKDSGIQVSQVHWRNDKLTAFRPYQRDGDLQGVAEFSNRMICVPVHWDVDIEYVAKVMNEFKW